MTTVLVLVVMAWGVAMGWLIWEAVNAPLIEDDDQPSEKRKGA